MFSENGKQRNSHPPFLDAGELRKALFRKELLTSKKEFSDSCLHFMLRMLEVRQEHKNVPFSKDLPSFLKRSIPHCFMHLETEKAKSVKSATKKMAISLTELISHKDGIERFGWAMEQAISIAEKESAERISTLFPAFFGACANMSINGREMDWGMFVSTYSTLRPEKAALFAVEISTAKEYPELYEKLSKHHSKLTRERMGAAFSY